LLLEPQYAHCHPSLANNARREIRRVTPRGTRTYVFSRITFGRVKFVVADRIGRS
jgi:hypothetical protein